MIFPSIKFNLHFAKAALKMFIRYYSTFLLLLRLDPLYIHFQVTMLIHEIMLSLFYHRNFIPTTKTALNFHASILLLLFNTFLIWSLGGDKKWN
jgi:hypothetical protein